MKIKKIFAQEILDSRANPTIEAEVTLADGTLRWAAVPSGASTGKYEAVELRDGDPKRYNGLGVLKAVDNVNKIIAPELVGLEAANQKEIDQKMIKLDGTKNKGNLGANAILAVSIAVARAEAVVENKPFYEYLSKFNPDHHGKYIMPITQMNIMNGGKHANWATDIQEYMVLPIGANSVVEGIRMCAETYFHLRKVLKEKKYSTNIGDEGGFAPDLTSNEEPFKLMIEAIERAGYKPGQDIAFGIDAAASEFYQYGKYNLKKEGLDRKSVV
jgi:enolase